MEVLRRIRALPPPPPIAVNCAVIPAELLESLLFGHVRVAFTGAVADRAGSFRGADGGRLFLDKTGDLPVVLARLEAAMIRRALVAGGGNWAEATRRLGLHRQLLHTKLARPDRSGSQLSAPQTERMRPTKNN